MWEERNHERQKSLDTKEKECKEAEVGVVMKLCLSKIGRNSLYNTANSVVLAVLGLDIAQHGKLVHSMESGSQGRWEKMCPKQVGHAQALQQG